MTDDAIPSFDHALEHYRAGRLGAARAALKGLLAEQPEHADGWTALGYLQRDIGDAAAAAAAFDAALRINAGDPRSLAGRARIALERAEPNALGRYVELGELVRKRACV